jgi:DNA-directed RNA polymerase specialized sigma24 family protein
LLKSDKIAGLGVIQLLSPQSIVSMDEQLNQLVRSVQQYPRESEERQYALSQLVDRILKSRKICRLHKGRSLDPIELKLIQVVQQQLEHKLDQGIDYCNPERISVREWVMGLLDQAFQQSIDEAYLSQLALKVQQQRPQTESWHQTINELLQTLHLSGKLHRPGYGRDAAVYEDAVTRTLSFVYQNIHAYDAQRGKFLAWVNYRLKMILLETQQELKEPLVQAVDGKVIRFKYQLNTLMKRSRQANITACLTLQLKGLVPSELTEIILITIVLWLLSQLSIKYPQQADSLLFRIAQACISPSFQRYEVTSEVSTLENIAQPQSTTSISEKMWEYFQLDPQQQCQKHIKNHPEATFQAIALARLHGKRWQDLSESFGVDVPTLSNFFQRRLRELAPKIRDYIQETLD